MYEYFGFGLQLLEDGDDMFLRFLHWLLKYHLSTPSKRSLQAWHMVSDGLAADELSFLFLFIFILCCFVLYFCFCFFNLFLWVWLLIHYGFFVVLKCP